MRVIAIIVISFLIFSCTKQKVDTAGSNHPNLILTPTGVQSMRANLGKAPLFDSSLETIRKQVDKEITIGIEVPIPKDLAGGYTHERHKANFFTMQKAGVLFQITEEEKYAQYVKDMLLQYAEIYPTLGKHPAERSYARGKFFWQCLNDANWLVYTSQAYDCIYDWLDKKTIEKLNVELFRPYAEYVSIDNPQFFNRIHNHSTWGNAGVGMIGLVMGDEELVNWSLYGLEIQTTGNIAKDNDGGSIQLKGQKSAGFLAQIDNAFSPDGYYTEGPYYQRYAMYPFLIFAQALANNKSELGILEYRNGLLLKAVSALINQTNSSGEFFPINDSQKGMSLDSRELVNAISMAYHYGGKNTALLSLIEEQGQVPLNDSGLSAARDIALGKSKPFVFKSLELTDGANGDEGAIGILRSKELTLVMKYAKQGMGHGHFDRLGFQFYDGSGEVIQDYGSARWVNIEHKDGGGYLKENNTWAKQTIAHNTLVVNNKTQFGSNVQKAEALHGEPYLFLADDPTVQLVSAKENNAYEGVEMQRMMALIHIEELQNPIVLDLYSVTTADKNDYYLPFYYKGELMQSSASYQVNATLPVLGDDNGLQHLWVEAEGEIAKESLSFTWYNNRTFYTITSATKKGDNLLLTRIGANDPKYHLRRDPGMMISRKNTSSTLFAHILETHGSYNPATEIPVNAFTSIEKFEILHESENYSVVKIALVGGKQYTFGFCFSDKKSSSKHSVQLKIEKIDWTGPYLFTESKKK